MPSLPPGYSMDAMNKLTNASKGKPWAVIAYHTSLNTNMGMSMLRAFVVDVVVVGLLVWILMRITAPSFGNIFLASLFTGFIVYLNQPYTYHIWYQTPGQLGYIIDEIAEWGITGAWLGWWLGRK